MEYNFKWFVMGGVMCCLKAQRICGSYFSLWTGFELSLKAIENGQIN